MSVKIQLFPFESYCIELARRAQISRQTVVNIEANLVQPSGSTMLVISEVLKRDPRDFFYLFCKPCITRVET
ncbi:hypothetical protein CHH49_09845 [Terribacillus saccharophilus]|uniref:helix-turn-helix transcriptional regulator n=1 Tax=Terribacillus saccharophilus TaxID=361277 RepID=UPI000BA5A4EE|nr:hypothetical protein CHH49_09845 [Terribacillus saccharophilus]